MKRNTALILGLGRFGGGAAAAAFLHRRGHALRIVDRAGRSDLTGSLELLARAGVDAGRVDWALDADDHPDTLDGIDAVVVNPAVPPDHPLLVEARRRGVPCTQECALFLEHYPGDTVLVTGTNGKSTTATLLARALDAAGFDVLLGGNIGHSLLDDEPRWREGQLAVLEISSFQLERIDPERHRARGAVLTRIGTDHLDRHGDIAAYRAAKARAAAAAREFVVHHAEDAVASEFPTAAPRRVLARDGAPSADEVGTRAGYLHSTVAADPGPALHSDALLVQGDFQPGNARLAIAAAAVLGADRHRAALGMALVEPLPFRLQRALVTADVEVWDDAVATGIDSTAAAARSLGGRLRWIGGGKSKDDDYASVVARLAPHVRSVHLFGAAARPLADAFARSDRAAQVSVHERLEDALDTAWSCAEPGDRLLFSPAFASFDQFPNFRARARAFHDWLGRLTERGTSG